MVDVVGKKEDVSPSTVLCKLWPSIVSVEHVCFVVGGSYIILYTYLC